IPVARPLPHVATHVVQPEAVGRKRRHRRCAYVAIFPCIAGGKPSFENVRHIAATRLELVPPGVTLPVEPPTRGPFIFGLGRQPLADPARVGLGVLISHLNYRVIGATAEVAAGSFGVTPVCSWYPAPPFEAAQIRQIVLGR